MPVSTGTSASRPTVFIPRDRYSAPDLKFLAQPQPPPVQQHTSVRQQRSSLSCPDNLDKATAPIRINNVEDWESLQMLLPKAFRNVLDKSEKQPQRKNTTRRTHSLQCIPSLPTSMLEEENVCPTCYKLQRGFSARDAPANMITSSCDCSTPSSSISSDNQNSSHLTGEVNFRTKSPPAVPVRTVFPSVSSIYACKDPSHSPRLPFSPSANLMEFSRQPAQLVINLSQKQGLYE